MTTRSPWAPGAGPHPSGDRGDSGFATVLGLAVIAGVMAVVLMVLTFGGVVAARHRARGAADLGALAAAAHVVDGVESACGRARWVAERMGARLVRCAVSGWDATVEVVVPGVAVVGSAAAAARAGPVSGGQAVGSGR
ncbi:Rv3654c family TadE-like protein [Actinokineospora cianjurensis]|uniref:Secretion/DNA translocation related TadE-like protein n=1 Tax=Actinokineospora cianjurensis TaxID=585224 RepID=A0A421B6N9_9PSEU|nr:Rv3654c family TadE-like protein [Actinokineospora cianjurensis]RLK59880.1 secretion/DNA translocation related TadE-like protein [Actinokineospora cianjurensis]